MVASAREAMMEKAFMVANGLLIQRVDVSMRKGLMCKSMDDGKNSKRMEAGQFVTKGRAAAHCR